jgi:hypothetical protein
MIARLKAAGQTSTDVYRNAEKLEQELSDAIRTQHVQAIEMGIATRLLAWGELKHVRPLDRAKELAEGKPVRDGKVVPFDDFIAARRRAMVEQTKDDGALSVIILGGNHDLTAAIAELRPGAEYLRVTSLSYPGE